jgi:hypothetical protein
VQEDVIQMMATRKMEASSGLESPFGPGLDGRSDASRSASNSSLEGGAKKLVVVDVEKVKGKGGCGWGEQVEC